MKMPGFIKRSFAALTAFAFVLGTLGNAILGCAGGDKVIVPATDETVQKGVIHYIGDHLGSANLMTDPQGNVLREESRYPYGLDWRVGGDEGLADYVYTGKEYDEETGLVYFGGRYYSPEMGRWITPDPLFLNTPAEASKRPLENNLYSYTVNNPVSYVDPNGEWIQAAIAVAAVGLMFASDAPGGVALSNANFATAIMPILNDYRDIYELATGKDLITKADLSLENRATCAFGLVIGSGALYREVDDFVDLYRGSINHYSDIMKNGLDPSRGRVFVTRDIKAAENAIGPYRYEVSQGSAADTGIVHSRIPKPLFEEYFAPWERPYPYGFGAGQGIKLDSTEIPLELPEQFEIFNKHIVK